jgi:hypothetical protein
MPKIEQGQKIRLTITGDLLLQAKETVSHNFGVILHLAEHHVGIVLGGVIIFNTYMVRTSIHLLWNRDVPITISITNLSEKTIKISQQKLVSVAIANIKGNRELKIEMNKIIQKTNKDPQLNGKIPERLANKFLECQVKTLCMPPDKQEKNQDSNFHETENIYSQASLHPFSATSYMLNVADQANHVLNLYAYENRAYTTSVNKKTYFAVYIKNLRVVACADSGSDLTLMQINLFKNIFPDYKKKLEQTTHISIKSYSNNQIKVFANVKQL